MRFKIKNQTNKEKFLCYCSKVTHKKFRNKLFSENNNLDVLCDDLDLAKHCAACLPNVEDEFFKLKGKNFTINSLTYSNKKVPFRDKIKKYLDFLGGVKLISQQGHLPMLSSKDVKTWLIISNDTPSLIEVPISSFKLELIIFDTDGNKIKKINQVIDKYKNYKICLNEFVPPPGEVLETFYVKLKRFPKHKGFRGSSRPHFFYETSNSMSALHIQDGDKKQNFINLPVSKNKDNNILFFINPSKKKVTIIPKIVSNNKTIKKEIKLENIILPSKGSKILILNQFLILNEEYNFQCQSSVRIKCYFIIADKHYNNISVDHI